MIWIALCAFWISCGAVAYAGGLADMQREYPHRAGKYRRKDVVFHLFLALFGPLALIPVAVSTGFFQHGFMWWPK